MVCYVNGWFHSFGRKVFICDQCDCSLVLDCDYSWRVLLFHKGRNGYGHRSKRRMLDVVILVKLGSFGFVDVCGLELAGFGGGERSKRR